ncbi:MAG: phosphotriesterase-related protein [Ruminococcaceae bacterium]|nr:phosphotriesterase-related protein [Oscillospiraceae bacterium]
MGQMINTVTGPIKPEQLGKTRMHEHFFYEWPGATGDATMWEVSRETVVARGVVVAKLLLEQGFKTVIDATTNDAGRNPEWLKEISEKSGLQIICCTGYYFDRSSGLGYWKHRSIFTDVVKEIEELFTTEVEKGIGKTGIKAGVIKVCISNHITNADGWFATAGAKSQKATGVPLISHTQNGSEALELAGRLLGNGAAPAKVVIGHMCGQPDAAYHEQILKLGASVALDRVGITKWGFPSDEQRLELLQKLLAGGWGGQVFLSQDATGVNMARPLPHKSPADAPYTADHFAILQGEFVPAALAAGVTQAQIDQILVENPARLFA